MLGLTHSFMYTRTPAINNLLLCCEPEDFVCSSVVPDNVQETLIKYAKVKDYEVCLWMMIVLFLKQRDHYTMSKALKNVATGDKYLHDLVELVYWAMYPSWTPFYLFDTQVSINQFRSAGLYTLTIAIDNGYYRNSKHMSLFDILAKLPVELRMRICNDSYELTKEIWISTDLIKIHLGYLWLIDQFVGIKK